MKKHNVSHCSYLLLTFLCVCAGCTTAVDPAVEAHRKSFVLAEEPAGAVGIEAVKESLAETESAAAVLVGRIGTDDDKTWEKGVAEFIVSDVPHSHDDSGHDAENCPFCQLDGKAAQFAVVRFVDAAGEVIDIDARQLFELEAGQTVVVSGDASIDEIGTLVIAANGIFAKASQ